MRRKTDLLLQDKRGVSPIIGYVLLIGLALGLAGGVYTYLANYVPSTNEQCSTDVQLVIQQVECSNQKVNITLVNRGLFSVDGVYVRVGEEGRLAKEDLTDCTPLKCNLYFINYNAALYQNGLAPGQSVSYEESYSGTGESEVEVQPLIFAAGNERKEILCTKSVIKQVIQCT